MFTRLKNWWKRMVAEFLGDDDSDAYPVIAPWTAKCAKCGADSKPIYSADDSTRRNTLARFYGWRAYDDEPIATADDRTYYCPKCRPTCPSAEKQGIATPPCYKTNAAFSGKCLACESRYECHAGLFSGHADHVGITGPTGPVSHSDAACFACPVGEEGPDGEDGIGKPIDWGKNFITVPIPDEVKNYTMPGQRFGAHGGECEVPVPDELLCPVTFTCYDCTRESPLLTSADVRKELKAHGWYFFNQSNRVICQVCKKHRLDKKANA